MKYLCNYVVLSLLLLGFLLTMSCNQTEGPVSPASTPTKVDQPSLQKSGSTGDGDLAIHLGDNTEPVGCDIWDFLGPEVQGGPAANGTENEIIMIVSPVDLFDVLGRELCMIAPWPEDPSSATLYSGDNVPLLSVKNRKIYQGDRRALSGQAIKNALLYKITNAYIRDGQAPANILMTATESLQHASAWRLLTIGALAEGYCGGNGLPDAN